MGIETAETNIARISSTLVDPSLKTVAQLYERRYVQALNGLFSQHDGTPMLAALNRGLSGMGGRLTVVEVGAGQGFHAMVIATAVAETEVVAVDTSPHAIARVQKRLPAYEPQFAAGSRVTALEGDIFAYLGDQEPGVIHGVHGNSWGHFLPDTVRARFYDLSYVAQTPGGFLAVSQKDWDDALLHQPTTEILSEDEKGIRATPADGITRIFYRSPEAAAAEIRRAGYRIVDTFNWRVGGYDFPRNPELEASFVGVLAQKVA